MTKFNGKPTKIQSPRHFCVATPLEDGHLLNYNKQQPQPVRRGITSSLLQVTNPGLHI